MSDKYVSRVEFEDLTRHLGMNIDRAASLCETAAEDCASVQLGLQVLLARVNQLERWVIGRLPVEQQEAIGVEVRACVSAGPEIGAFEDSLLRVPAVELLCDPLEEAWRVGARCWVVRMAAHGSATDPFIRVVRSEQLARDLVRELDSTHDPNNCDWSPAVITSGIVASLNLFGDGVTGVCFEEPVSAAAGVV